MLGRPATAIGLVEEQVEDRPEDVDLDLVVLVLVPVGVDEDLEVVLVEDDHVATVVGPPEIRLVHPAGDVEVLVVPEHLRSRQVPRTRAGIALDVAEGLGPGGEAPGPGLEIAVESRRFDGPSTVVPKGGWRDPDGRLLDGRPVAAGGARARTTGHGEDRGEDDEGREVHRRSVSSRGRTREPREKSRRIPFVERGLRTRPGKNRRPSLPRPERGASFACSTRRSPAGTPRVGTKGTTQKARSRRRRSVASASGRDDPDLVPSRTNSNHSTSPRPQVVGSLSSIKPNRTRTTPGPHDVAASMVHRTPPPQGGGVPRDRGFERRGPLTPQVHPQPRRPGRADDRRTRVRREDGRDHRAVGDPEAIRRSCSFLLGKVGTRGTRLGRIEGDGNRHDSEFGASKAHGKEPLRDTVTNTPGALVTPLGRMKTSDIAPDLLFSWRHSDENGNSRPPPCVSPDPSVNGTPSESRDASPTPCQERELPAVVGPRDRRMLERDSSDHSPNTDARSGGNGNAAGSGPAVGRRRGQLNDTPDLVSPLASPGDAERDAFPPRSSGEGDLARGFTGEDVGLAGIRIFQGGARGGRVQRRHRDRWRHEFRGSRRRLDVGRTGGLDEPGR